MSCRYVCCYLASQADPRRFKRAMPFWVSTAKQRVTFRVFQKSIMLIISTPLIVSLGRLWTQWITILEHLPIRGVVLEWFKNYLTNRKQIVKYKLTVSNSLSIKCGVRQGSVLGPLLFLIYVPCIRQLRPRNQRQSKPWCPVGVLRNAWCTGFSFLVTVQNTTTDNSRIFRFVSKSKSL